MDAAEYELTGRHIKTALPGDLVMHIPSGDVWKVLEVRMDTMSLQRIRDGYVSSSYPRDAYGQETKNIQVVTEKKKPVVTEKFANMYEGDRLGYYVRDSKEEVDELARYSHRAREGILKFTLTDDKVTGVELLKPL